MLTDALRIDQGLPDSDWNVADDLTALFSLRFRLGDVSGAERYQRQRWELYARSSGPDASITQHAAANLAVALAYQGKLDEARPLADRAFEKTRTVPDYQRMMPVLASAMVRNFAGQPKEAEPFARDAVRIAPKSYSMASSVYAECAAELGISLVMQGRAEEALPLLRDADQVLSKANIPDYPPVGRIHKYYLQAQAGK